MLILTFLPLLYLRVWIFPESTLVLCHYLWDITSSVHAESGYTWTDLEPDEKLKHAHETITNFPRTQYRIIIFILAFLPPVPIQLVFS